MPINHPHLQIKCDQYWPNRGTESYAGIQVELRDVMELATYTIRTFLLTRVSERVKVRILFELNTMC